MKLLLKITEWGIFLAVLIILFVLASPMLPTKKYIATYIVSTGSMEPAIKTGSIVLVKKTSPADVVIGDVISFTDPGDLKKTIIHRIASIQLNEEGKAEFITKGDNNESEDAWKVTPNLLKGKEILTVPYVGYLANYLKTPLGFSLLIVIPALLLAALQIKKIKEGISDEVKKKTNQALAKLNADKPTVIVLLCFILSGSLIFNTRTAYGLFSDSVTITGVKLEVEEFYRRVSIDIKPGEAPNAVNLKGNGVIPVAVLGEVYFDVNTIDSVTVDFEGAHPEKWNFEDVNSDGIEDVIYFFKTEDITGLNSASTKANLIGQIIAKNWMTIEGDDSVYMVPPGKEKDTSPKNESAHAVIVTTLTVVVATESAVTPTPQITPASEPEVTTIETEIISDNVLPLNLPVPATEGESTIQEAILPEEEQSLEDATPESEPEPDPPSEPIEEYQQDVQDVSPEPREEVVEIFVDLKQ